MFEFNYFGLSVHCLLVDIFAIEFVILLYNRICHQIERVSIIVQRLNVTLVSYNDC